VITSYIKGGREYMTSVNVYVYIFYRQGINRYLIYLKNSSSIETMAFIFTNYNIMLRRRQLAGNRKHEQEWGVGFSIEVCFSAPPFPNLNRNLNTSRVEIAPYPFIT
jgi:hypothetical protein